MVIIINELFLITYVRQVCENQTFIFWTFRKINAN